MDASDDALRALARTLGGPPDTGEGALRVWLAAEVARLLDRDRPRLMAVLYRVDVRERDVAAAFAAPDVPAALADALVTRMREKLRYRSAPPP